MENSLNTGRATDDGRDDSPLDSCLPKRNSLRRQDAFGSGRLTTAAAAGRRRGLALG